MFDDLMAQWLSLRGREGPDDTRSPFPKLAACLSVSKYYDALPGRQIWLEPGCRAAVLAGNAPVDSYPARQTRTKAKGCA